MPAVDSKHDRESLEGGESPVDASEDSPHESQLQHRSISPTRV